MSMNEVMNGMMNQSNAVQAAAMFGTGVTVNDVTEVNVTESTSEKMYTLRGLCARDIFGMVKIIRKIGLKDFAKCFEPNEIKAITDSFSESENIEEMAETVGFSVVLKIVDMILERLPDIGEELFAFLAGLIGKTQEEVSNLPMDVFFELVVDVFNRKEFMGFMKAALKLLK